MSPAPAGTACSEAAIVRVRTVHQVDGLRLRPDPANQHLHVEGFPAANHLVDLGHAGTVCVERRDLAAHSGAAEQRVHLVPRLHLAKTVDGSAP